MFTGPPFGLSSEPLSVEPLSDFLRGNRNPLLRLNNPLTFVCYSFRIEDKEQSTDTTRDMVNKCASSSGAECFDGTSP